MSSSSSSQRSIDTAYKAYHRLRLGWQLAIFLLIALSVTWSIVTVEIGRLRDMAERESKLEMSNLAHAFVDRIQVTLVE